MKNILKITNDFRVSLILLIFSPIFKLLTANYKKRINKSDEFLSWLYHPANILSVSRVLLLPLFVYFHFNEFFYLNILLIIYFGLSDFIDGALFLYIKNKLDINNKSGHLIDAYSDRIMSITLLLFIVNNDFISPKIILMIESVLLGSYLLCILLPGLNKYRMNNHNSDDLIGKLRFLFSGIYILVLYEYLNINFFNFDYQTIIVSDIGISFFVIFCILSSFFKFIHLNIKKYVKIFTS